MPWTHGPRHAPEGLRWDGTVAPCTEVARAQRRGVEERGRALERAAASLGGDVEAEYVPTAVYHEALEALPVQLK